MTQPTTSFAPLHNPVALGAPSELRAMDLMSLARRALAESRRFYRHEEYDPRYAYELFRRALVEREELHSTGIGDGIALPHARNALVGLVTQPTVVFARHAAGLHYNAIDGQPAHLIFLLVAPNVTVHLGMLARISRLLRDPKLRRDLMAATTPAQAIELLWNAEGA